MTIARLTAHQLAALTRRAHVHTDLCYGRYEPCGEHHMHDDTCGSCPLRCRQTEDVELAALLREVIERRHAEQVVESVIGARVLELVVAEIRRAREKHGMSIELRNDDGRARILTEEVGEVSRAIEDLELAELRRYEGSKTKCTAWLEGAREAVADARAHVVEEVVQVAASAIRWIIAATTKP